MQSVLPLPLAAKRILPRTPVTRDLRATRRAKGARHAAGCFLLTPGQGRAPAPGLFPEPGSAGGRGLRTPWVEGHLRCVPGGRWGRRAGREEAGTHALHPAHPAGPLCAGAGQQATPPGAPLLPAWSGSPSAQDQKPRPWRRLGPPDTPPTCCHPVACSVSASLTEGCSGAACASWPSSTWCRDSGHTWLPAGQRLCHAA